MIDNLNELNVVPLGKTLLVKKAEKEKVRDLGNGKSIVLVNNDKHAEVLHDVGRVVSAGKLADQNWLGQAVLYEKYSGKDLNIGEGQYSLIDEDNLLAWIKTEKES